ncbi:unnamed protein product [Medioppia subpectinata]|uniref:Uncharacterized protein n=1 Tax=Medioppia subpectinata TaxID=1979941 RepID=A0A7R9KHE2_9ACAR|nr:unnamed protein product [Medioppia subpectinata]CAG2103316.1 unnamed protein product [Medioppia subpectinata]
MIANISSSVITTGMHNTNNQHFCRNGIIVNSLPSNPTREECWRVNCSNPVITCIVATVLPITITSLLICGFMMQKNNLHEYAIYTFVIFCLAFIFPFALFFFTVIVHKSYLV